MSEPLENRVIILNGYSDSEIVAIMRIVKSIYGDVSPEQALGNIAAARQLPEREGVEPGDLIFAKATENSRQMKLAEIIADVSEDHEYLRKNPPPAAGSDPGAPEDDG